jgi:hypothetical protein
MTTATTQASAGAPVRSRALLAAGWDCRCGYRQNGAWMTHCASCWADRETGDRQWAQLAEMDFRPGGDTANAPREGRAVARTLDADVRPEVTHAER